MFRQRSRTGCSKAAFILSALSACGLAVYIWRYEAYRHTVLYVCSVTLLISTVMVLLTRRILLASLMTTTFVALVRAVAVEKHGKMNMTLHAYDIVFYLSSWPILSFLWSHFRMQFLAFLVAIFANMAAAWITFGLDNTRVRRRHSLCAVVVLGLVAYLSAPARVESHYWEHFLDDRSLTSFYSSWGDTAQILWRGHLFDAAADAPHAQFRDSPRCQRTGELPNIILIHQESMVPPGAILDGNLYNASLDNLFRSHDGKIHKLRVETYGGASWLTEFSAMTGLSTHSFGSMRPFVQAMMAGNVKATLPETLRECGYHGSVFYPAQRTFGSSELFYKSIGMSDFFDMHDQRAPTIQERDHFYYENAMSYMSRHFQKSSQPLFTFILTMSGHQPYKSPYMPEFVASTEPPHLDPEMNEWLRRVAMVNADYASFKAELSRRFPGKPFLFVHYGDHQPTVTRPYVDFNEQTFGSQVNPSAYTTYFAVEGLNYTPAPLPDVETLDITYLGLALLKAAKIPLTDVYRTRERLMTLCNGRYHDCPFRQQILEFHRQLIDAGLITMPG
jgi:hypothetical protein